MVNSKVPWTLASEDFTLERVAALKGDATVAVIIPAKNEAATIGSVLESVLNSLSSAITRMTTPPSSLIITARAWCDSKEVPEKAPR